MNGAVVVVEDPRFTHIPLMYSVLASRQQLSRAFSCEYACSAQCDPRIYIAGERTGANYEDAAALVEQQLDSFAVEVRDGSVGLSALEYELRSRSRSQVGQCALMLSDRLLTLTTKPLVRACCMIQIHFTVLLAQGVSSRPGTGAIAAHV